MLNLYVISHNHRPFGVNFSAKIIRRGISMKISGLFIQSADQAAGTSRQTI